MKRVLKIVFSILTFALSLLPSHSLAADNLGPMMPMTGLHNAEFDDFESEFVDEEFRIFVAAPTYVESGKTYPVIYVLDANGFFGTVTDTARLLAISGEIPAAYVVGIGYAVDDGLVGTLSKRYRDLTPTRGGELEELFRRVGAAAEPVIPGGGPAFLRFIVEELKPAIEAAYPVDPEDSTIGGGSLAGLFGAWVLLTQPEEFQRYIIFSPSVWWNEYEFWRWEEALAVKTKDVDATVFVTAGGLERVELLKAQSQALLDDAEGPAKEDIVALVDGYEKYGYPRMASITPEFVDKLKSRNYPSLRVDEYNLPDETHLSIGPAAWSRGLRYIYGVWVP